VTTQQPRTANREPQSATSDTREALSILMVAPEAHPFAKTGGLAEVTAALTDAIARLGHSVVLVLPRYRGIDVSAAQRIDTRLRFGTREQPVAIHEQPISNRVTVALVDVPELFDRDALYGTAAGDYPDNAWRFAVLARAALEYPRVRKWRPSIIHTHDWQAGLVPVYQKMQFSLDPYVGGVPAVFTLHNLAFQGVFPASSLGDLGFGLEVMDVQALEFWGNISYLKGGINFSERITTVSPGYAREIVQPELGFGFEGVLARRSDDLVGILNGIDTKRWSPEADAYVAASFNADNLAGKRAAKRALLAATGLPADDASLEMPVIGLVSRLTDQKGFDLIAASIDQLLAYNARWVMLGNGERRYEELWRALAATHPTRVSATIGFDERMAHHIEAGADMFLMPSRFEPCGLNQMYSLRYGTVPIVRATGGLDDTVIDVDTAQGTGTGFKFRDYTPEALVKTVERALVRFQDRADWAAIQRRGMRQDHSWDVSAAKYVKLYEGLHRTVVASAAPSA
jgi:starch synthase